MDRTAAIVLAAGSGQRMAGPEGPKQFRPLGTGSVLDMSLQVFAASDRIAEIIVVRPSSVPATASGTAPVDAVDVVGGASRRDSVRAGLQAALELSCDKVLIHDAARPFVSHDLVRRVTDAIAPGVAVSPAAPIVDTLRRRHDDGRCTLVSREALHAMQTPQGFVLAEIIAAHDAAPADLPVTDDVALAEWAGLSVRLVEGSRSNFKITTQEDMELARRMTAIPDIRTGLGYDIHALGPGDAVTLCGVRIPHDGSLQGHSDADVGFHALTDALLGAIGDGDIGTHFPPSDPQWKGAASATFLAHAASLVRAAGGTPTHVDVSLVCEAPRIGPYRDAMRSAIAAAVGIDVARVGLKATTNEGLGALGRGEGIAAMATATVVMGGWRP